MGVVGGVARRVNGGVWWRYTVGMWRSIAVQGATRQDTGSTWRGVMWLGLVWLGMESYGRARRHIWGV